MTVQNATAAQNATGSGATLLSRRELAARLKISVFSVARHVAARYPGETGRVPVIRIGKLHKFRLEDVERWIEEQAASTGGKDGGRAA